MALDLFANAYASTLMWMLHPPFPMVNFMDAIIGFIVPMATSGDSLWNRCALGRTLSLGRRHLSPFNFNHGCSPNATVAWQLSMM